MELDGAKAEESSSSSQQQQKEEVPLTLEDNVVDQHDNQNVENGTVSEGKAKTEFTSSTQDTKSKVTFEEDQDTNNKGINNVEQLEKEEEQQDEEEEEVNPDLNSKKDYIAETTAGSVSVVNTQNNDNHLGKDEENPNQNFDNDKSTEVGTTIVDDQETNTKDTNGNELGEEEEKGTDTDPNFKDEKGLDVDQQINQRNMETSETTGSQNEKRIIADVDGKFPCLFSGGETDHTQVQSSNIE